MEIFPLQTPLIKPGQKLIDILLKIADFRLHEKDILAISSKIISVEQGRVSYQADFEKLLYKEADHILGPAPYALTIKNKILIPNAGIDHSNTPKGTHILWPQNLKKHLDQMRARLKFHFEINALGLLAVDSCCHPLRNGVSGLALEVSGFLPIDDCRTRHDLYRKPLEVTKRNLADMLASTAVLMMGETDESTPFAIIKGAPVIFSDKKSSEKLSIPAKDCLFSRLYPPKILHDAS